MGVERGLKSRHFWVIWPQNDHVWFVATIRGCCLDGKKIRFWRLVFLFIIIAQIVAFFAFPFLLQESDYGREFLVGGEFWRCDVFRGVLLFFFVIFVTFLFVAQVETIFFAEIGLF